MAAGRCLYFLLFFSCEFFLFLRGSEGQCNDVKIKNCFKNTEPDQKEKIEKCKEKLKMDIEGAKCSPEDQKFIEARVKGIFLIMFKIDRNNKMIEDFQNDRDCWQNTAYCADLALVDALITEHPKSSQECNKTLESLTACLKEAKTNCKAAAETAGDFINLITKGLFQTVNCVEEKPCGIKKCLERYQRKFPGCNEPSDGLQCLKNLTQQPECKDVKENIGLKKEINGLELAEKTFCHHNKFRNDFLDKTDCWYGAIQCLRYVVFEPNQKQSTQCSLNRILIEECKIAVSVDQSCQPMFNSFLDEGFYMVCRGCAFSVQNLLLVLAAIGVTIWGKIAIN